MILGIVVMAMVWKCVKMPNIFKFKTETQSVSQPVTHSLTKGMYRANLYVVKLAFFRKLKTSEHCRT